MDRTRRASWLLFDDEGNTELAYAAAAPSVVHGSVSLTVDSVTITDLTTELVIIKGGASLTLDPVQVNVSTSLSIILGSVTLTLDQVQVRTVGNSGGAQNKGGEGVVQTDLWKKLNLLWN